MKRGSYPKTIPLTSPANPSTTNGAVIDATSEFSVSAQLVATGSAAGTFKMQGSNDIGPATYMDTYVPTNWTDITGTLVTISGAGTYMITNTNICYQYIRFVYASTGTGTIVVNAKSLSM